MADITDHISQQLPIAAWNGDLAKVNSLLADPLIDVDYQDNKGNTALILASVKTNTDVVKALLAKGANKTLTNNNGQTANGAAIIARDNAKTPETKQKRQEVINLLDPPSAGKRKRTIKKKKKNKRKSMRSSFHK